MSRATPWAFSVGDAVRILRGGKLIGGRVVAADPERFGVLLDGGIGEVEIFLQDTPAVQRVERQRK